ncbi:MAG: 3'-5' exonuclease [Chlorobium limicola]|jgi:DNA polymerase III subunit epsilon|uniref:DNA polymerase III, epsilon subunit n=1 Tax=Chlorobium limicola (strain DSM 245 / NBRC 103803 / 6330) TaxID=290315 RepID=B3ED79_CHLL2|nr:3'-5' exonuclease [Chlorobium limicola]ACD90504.1 DNA polymerase III, epsilon subunit [Chlorobium limicola DSM 245]NTV21473.1 3'-5' exonuclease [Chlorobium limicola]
MQRTLADSVVVLDFETTGLSPQYGDRAIEIGAVLVEHGEIVDRFQKLMNPGFRISSFIEGYTGITNEMLKGQPCCEEVMAEFSGFIAGRNIVAHNASFDRRFLDFELKRAKRVYEGACCCSLLVSRRIYQDSPNHRLQTLVTHAGIPETGSFHRALADAEMTALLWMSMIDRIRRQYGISAITFDQLSDLSKIDKLYTHRYLTALAEELLRKEE